MKSRENSSALSPLSGARSRSHVSKEEEPEESNEVPSDTPLRMAQRQAHNGDAYVELALHEKAADSEGEQHQHGLDDGKGKKKGGLGLDRAPLLPHEYLIRALPYGRQISKATKHPCCAFLLVQFFVIWFVAVSVIFMHDLAAQMRPKQKLKSALKNQNFVEKLSQRLKERCPLQGPVCRLASMSAASFDASQVRPGSFEEPENADLPTVIFFAGVEGSGHKFFEQVFRRLPVNFSVVAFEPELHLTFEPTQELLYKDFVDAKCPLLPYPRALRAFAREILKRLKTVGQGPYIRARDSYPLGRVRTPLARPDLLHFLELDGHVYNLKVVVLQRGLADAVRSTFRAGYHAGDVGLQARIVEDEMAFLDTSVRLLPCGKYIVLDFDWTADDPKLIAQPLAEFLDLGISADDVINAVKGAVQTKPMHHTDYPEFGGQPMEEFFALRTDMWPLLAAARLTPYFWPHTPRDWPEENADAPFLFERRRGYDYEF